MLPAIPTWLVQWKPNVPAVAKVREALPVVLSATFAGAPAAASNVTLCATSVPFVQVTVPPRAIVTADGRKDELNDP